MSTLEYKGLPPKQEGVAPYVPQKSLIQAVNVAIALERPLLLKGEPGCGKTKLARAVADELELPYFEWNVKSTSRAQDGLYTYDTIGRLRDAQLAASTDLTKAEKTRIRKRFQDPTSYIIYGPLGNAFLSEKRAVVLIDEIDKADIDFPNDLLHELEEKQFTINEVPVEAVDDAQKQTKAKEVPANHPPIIFITSNAEKELPAAFLRRCLFYHITFPNEARLRQIVSIHRGLKENDPFLARAVTDFMALREKMKNNKSGKPVSTSELLDWVEMLQKTYADRPDELPPIAEQLLFPSVLLKTLTDYTLFGPEPNENEHE
ncbi:MAG: MoxR family ATPase [Ardenticatenaceae bacterium]|nr:MoxR family ATPase [Ardenticatenaceae bacterium]